MPNLTTNYSFNKPLVNDPIDEDLWGGQLNSNWDSLDTLLFQAFPVGSVIWYGASSAPTSFLICDGSEVSRTTYATLFGIVSTTFGVGDGSTTFNVPDLRGRTPIGMDDMGTAAGAAGRITDAQADVLGGSGGSENQTPAGSVSGSAGSTSLSESQLASHDHTIPVYGSDSGGAFVADGSGSNTFTASTNNAGSGSSHTHSWSGSFSGNAMDVTQPWLAGIYLIKH